MKISNQIIIVIIFIALVFIIKDDYKSIYSKTLSYIEQGIGKSSDLQNKASELINSINSGNSINNDKLPEAIKAPGALVVSDDFLTRDLKNIKLSSKGVISITNKQRLDNGNLAPLKENSKLNFSAEKKLQDMFVKQYFEHVSPEGVGVGELGAQVGYEYIIIGENLALGNFKDDSALVDAWMASPGHKANILNKKYTELGVAVGKGEYEGKSVWMAVQHFGLPKSACPTIDGVLKSIIGIDQSNINAIESELASKRAKIDSGAIFEGMTTNGQIDSYNALVNEYNKLILNIKEKINKYNGEVRDFNNCIATVN
ncbi:MAG: SCP-like protein extracellular [Candidatus Nomurabacteria bacterium GW2011_GWF2_35_66]|uniref:SCP-like protein extracellular n=1 Tax=Candidatus Nomurabacteria bacterium GW2011_GWE1_35_16 TaxID=1618761 RepID=A0A0G0B8B6_9BACT|nr:MAG: SCP-like protein extracellular [Candidatus Nomurabacteria bacterium GW2011_GWF1_34_20]KKP63424.1 MAG: SCP-like protein extracellular [Candidatus Nomurabacteria bacterium GW2011_GWE2_34_25]KKP65608.1 MAG: SCP-like protein extracellular [Candidatus Nomurabacteria bacterium GW2011_GWE1_35_16]KKP83662.1 MAG: SCP-like protein extracellular [Candidatus Nomurabacteria bacterium GW2011_GWF2_35_66]HAE36919.1 hypothetical protein [Candidatus Nomurabacteria bacterium]